MNRFLNAASIVFAAAVLALGGAPARAAELKVVTTLPSLADITRNVGGDRVEVEAICKGYEDPHYLQAKPSYAKTLRKADLLVYAGLDLEVGWLPPLLDTARNPKLTPGSPGLLEASNAVEHKLEVPTGDVNRAQGDIHPFGNPHFMLDPRIGLAVAGLIADRLGDLDPPGAATYQANLETFRSKLQGRIDAWDAMLAPYKDTPVVAYHKQWEYLNDWTGFRVVDYIESKPGIPPAPRHVEAVVDEIKADKVRLVMAATFTDEDAARTVGERGGAKVLILPAEVGGVDGADSYVALFEFIVGKLTGALGSN